jgi:hypothetical protein
VCIKLSVGEFCFGASIEMGASAKALFLSGKNLFGMAAMPFL